MRISWNEQMALAKLKRWINDGQWRGTTHFRQHNSSLYEYLYRTMGLDEAFKKLGLHYADFKKTSGKHERKRTKREIVNELRSIITSGKWKSVRHLQETNSSLYRDLSRIGFQEAFNKIGLDYKHYRYTIWTKEKILHELHTIIENDDWHGPAHLKEHHSSLYNAIQRHLGFEEAFQALGLDYNDYIQHRLNNFSKKMI